MSTTSPAFLLGTGPDRLFAEFASKRLTVCCTAGIDPRLPQPVVVNLADSIRALSGPKMQALADAIERHQPRQLWLQQLRVNMGEFCSVVVPRMVGVNELVLYRCDRLSVADLALLSVALTAAGVCLTKLECAVQNAEGSGMSDAVAALCSAHPSIECLSLPGLDDSDHHPDTRQRYTLIAALVGSAESTRLRQIRLPNTPPPVDFDLVAMKAYEHQDKVDTMFFTFEGSPNSATLYAHADAYAYLACRALGLSQADTQAHMLQDTPSDKIADRGKKLSGFERAADKKWHQSRDGLLDIGTDDEIASAKASCFNNCNTLASKNRCPFAAANREQALREAGASDNVLAQLANNAAHAEQACGEELIITFRAQAAFIKHIRHYVAAAQTRTKTSEPVKRKRN